MIRRPADLRRRASINIAILVAVAIAFGLANAYGSHAVLVVGAVFIAYVPAYGAYRLIRARPPAPLVAWVWWFGAAASITYAIVHTALTGRLHPAEMLFVVAFVWGFIFVARGIVLASVFAREGGASDRFRDVLSARRAQRAESVEKAKMDRP